VISIQVDVLRLTPGEIGPLLLKQLEVLEVLQLDMCVYLAMMLQSKNSVNGVSQTPAIKPYRMAIRTALVTELRPIIPNMMTEADRAEATIMLTVPTEWTRNPGTRRPIKLEAFMMTS